MGPKSRFILVCAACAAILLVSLSAGTVFISPLKIPGLLFGEGSGAESAILLSLRIPRLALAMVIGGSLAVSGALFQALLRNPLSDPYTIGVSGGAALGAALAIIFSWDNTAVVLCSFAGSITVIFMVYLFSRRVRPGGTTLVLAGIALSFIFSSAVLLVFAVSRAEQVHRAMLWLMGDLSTARYTILRGGSVISLCLMGLAFFYYKHLNILSFGDTFARSLGVRESEVRNIFWIAALLSAIAVSLAGVIGFVGLIVPHVFRYLFGPDHRLLLPSSAIGGGLFLVLCDTLGRSAVPPYEIPSGVITGFIGGIFFILLLLRKGNTLP